MTARASKSAESAFEAETDLRAITRDADKCRTTVALYLDGYTRTPWLRFGQAQLSSQSERHTGRSRLEARMTAGVTDFEHDSAYALRLPLIGVQFDGLLVRYHTTFLIGWIDPDAEEDFRVPGPSYDPAKLQDAHRCRDVRCLKDNPDGHIIVPEGYYVPPHNPKLYKLVAGKRVEIAIGPAWPERSESH